MQSEKYFVLFNGTSYYVGGVEDVNGEVEIIDEFYNIDRAQRMCDILNETL